MSVILDRTINNNGGKSLPNRQRFLQRVRENVKKAIKDHINGGAPIKTIGKDGVRISGKGVFEPHIHNNPKKGNKDYVVPGNKSHIKGDTVARPPEQGEGKGPRASKDGEGEDDFEFVITREEFLDYFFEDLELPDMTKRMIKEAVTFKTHRAGYSVAGNPSALNVRRSMRNAMGRRLALNRPSKEEMREAQDSLAQAQLSGDRVAIDAAEKVLEDLKRRARGIPYVDPIDLRYNRFEKRPDPNTSAVVFMLMDVSGSMDEVRKDLAKRFFILLHLFIERQYDRVNLVFIRHTHEATECTEEEFFHSRETGGTVVSSALEKMIEVRERDYPLDAWNIYVCQASDGDCGYDEEEFCQELMMEKILPIVQYFAYIEVKPHTWDGESTGLWDAYSGIPEQRKFQMRQVNEVNEIYEVLADLFTKHV